MHSLATYVTFWCLRSWCYSQRRTKAPTKVGFILKGDNGHLSISVSLYNVLLLHIAPHEDYCRTPYDLSLFSFTFSSEVSSKLSEGGDFTNAHLLALKLQFFTVDWKVLTIKVASPPIDPIVSVFSSNDRRAIYYYFIVSVFRPSAYVLQTVPFIGSSKGNHQNHRGLFYQDQAQKMLTCANHTRQHITSPVSHCAIVVAW